MSRKNALIPGPSVIQPGNPQILTEPFTPGIQNRCCCRMNTFCFLPVWVIALLLAPGHVNANSLNLNLNNQLDIVSGFVDVEYEEDDAVVANGFALELDHDGDPSTPGIPIIGGLIYLEAEIDADGDLYDGEFYITGEIPSLNLGPGILLEAELVEFGFQPGGGEPFEFIYEVTGGDAADIYGGIDALGGLILSRTGFRGSFEEAFDNKINETSGTGMGVIDLAPLQ